ncbi:unnamed protein product [Cyclocybe aegerita]|uniref:Uncharacterized protein n=1 Tax=Cyclocybe aegerita TaxID=1973307 RepID=A0A8S0WTG7_CYCAE|nr:unnamed protein product [Cyclocybe aegerita]
MDIPPQHGWNVNEGQYALKFRDTVEDLPGDLEVLTTSIAKATDWILRAAHHNPLTIDGGDAFVAQMTSFVNAVMATDFSRIRGPDELDSFSLTSLLEAEMSSKDEPTIHPAPVFRPPPPAAHGPLDEGVVGVGAPPDVLMQALDNLGRLASPPRIPASKKHKGVDRPVPPPPQKKSKVAYSCPGPPPLINHPSPPAGRDHTTGRSDASPASWLGTAASRALSSSPHIPDGSDEDISSLVHPFLHFRGPYPEATFSDAWFAHSTESKPTKRSKSWWTDECSETFGVYQLSRSLADYNKFKKAFLDELPDEPVREWADFSEHELLSALKGCSNSSAPGPDHVTWVHLKELLKDKHVLALFIVLANACLRVGHWPRIFKESLSVIVPKPNKPSYSVPKAFRPIDTV